MADEVVKSTEYNLEPDSELRFEIETKNDKAVVELKSGSAELFGTELVKGEPYEFTTGTKVAIFTYDGCQLEIKGRLQVSNVAKKTPMVQYRNSHAALEQMREIAEKNHTQGPIAMVVGPTDVGKSTLCRILLNYAVRAGRQSMFVDLDIGQGSISIPGTVGALLVDRPANLEEGFSQHESLVYHFGHNVIQANDGLYKILVSKLAKVTLERLQANAKTNASGIIINTCGWVTAAGYKYLLNAYQAFEVGTIYVLDDERLYNELLRDVPSFVKVVLLPKSGGVVERSGAIRGELRDIRIKEYFYGQKSPLCPHSFDVKWADLKIFKVGAPKLAKSILLTGKNGRQMGKTNRKKTQKSNKYST